MRRPRRAGGRRAAALAAAVLTVGAAGSAGAAGALHAAERAAATAALDLRAAAVGRALDTTLGRYADTLHALTALAAAAPAAGADALLGTAVTALAAGRLPGAHEVYVLGPDRSVRAARPVDGSTPPPPRAPAGPPEVAAALTAARELGGPVVSAAHVLARDHALPPARRQNGFVLTAPVPSGTGGSGGWVVVTVRAGDLLDAALRDARVTGVAVTLSGAHGDVAGPAGGAAGARTVAVGPAGQGWRARVSPATDLLGPAQRWADTLALAAGGLGALLLAGLTLRLAGGRDAARRRAAAAERDAAAARAGLAARERELAGFAAVAGEELQAPLGAIAGYGDLLTDEHAADLGAARGVVDRIAAAARRGLALVDDLLAWSGTADPVVRTEPVDLERLAADVLAERVGGAGARPVVDLGELPVVLGDAELLRRLLDHLVGNALRYVPPGAAARVALRARELAGNRWRVEVADRGIGVPADRREEIFAPFRRTPAAGGYPGTGLGLAVARRITELHGGAIGVEPNPGGGSVFWFTVLGATGGDPAVALLGAAEGA
ncbi:ATP-binding protein [Spirilliplanes yamanashiensis]|uniref:Sensor-like histidine kinase SenX3 n=1 Tax=Spirilliplanes yamanashiensis TaxID=42233 RepID=A0A8J3Y7Y5_9ACTN|nr:ATP-binding protein [Spirilliplanes yamanashiensis]MDP9817193.1 signal transduction histidine kinase [Spirilliplanes yamanashiensis]GIJ03154.1 hypothetical protein Sya03_25060 [Spirilliplanes yamanashiensis]